jgi:hypothetical protein
MNVAGFHHKILVGLTAWTRYFSDEQLVYFTTSMSSQKKPGVNAKKMGGKFSKYDECCWFSSQNLGWPDCPDTFFFCDEQLVYYTKSTSSEKNPRL